MTLAESPFIVAIDQREKLPYQFAGLRTDAKDHRRPLLVRTAYTCLPSGDYSIVGHTGEIAVERKSLADAYGTFGKGRARFERELARLQGMTYAAVVIEAPWGTILQGHCRSRLSPKTVLRSVIAWQQRFPAVHWWCVCNRQLAEVVTYRILERFWRNRPQT